MAEESIEEAESTFILPAKVIYNFRYDTKAPKVRHLFQFDGYPIPFDHRALQSDKPEPYATFKYPIEHTLFLIKPKAMIYRSQIRKRIYEEGYICLQEKTIWLTNEQASEFYIEHYGKPWFPKFIMKMTDGPVHIMILAKDNAIEDLRQLMGHKRVSVARREAPFSLRAMYGLRGDSATNGVHGSENKKAAVREIHFFYPQVIPEPLPEVFSGLEYLEKNVNTTLLNGLLEVNKEKPSKPLKWLADWHTVNNREKPMLFPDFIMYIPYQ